MIETNVLTVSRYRRLVGDIRRLIEEGKARAVRTANQEIVATYWQIGKRIHQEKLSANAGYGSAMMSRLAEELDVDIRTLHQAVAFFKSYIVCPRAHNLSWSHYRLLMNIRSGPERTFYECETERHRWTRDQLLNAMKRGEYEKAKGAGLRAKDTGQKLSRPKEATYVYKAIVERVVDGDTLLLRIDLGFQVWKEQRIRLAGIDTPPGDDPQGRAAYEYVRDQLGKVPFVMVCTNKIDIYGRYIGHIFYSLRSEKKDEIFTRGRYLNQELLERGFARTV